MEPILLIHGYSSEGKENSAKEIYGTLPAELRKRYGAKSVFELNLSRWISLNDGINLDDVSYAMERALRAEYAHLLESNFNVVIHSTGALVVRNWVKNHSPKPSPINKIVHLAGANFGSGLAHIGKGQLARWGRLIFTGTGRGLQVLNELEFGSWKTLDMHLSFLKAGEDIYDDYQIQEFCINGSQTLTYLRPIPIRYVKEDSADNTVRTSACNLNYNYISITPKANAQKLKHKTVQGLLNKRQDNTAIENRHYDYNLDGLCKNRREVPFAVAYETAHFGTDIGIVSGSKNRASVMPLINAALITRQTDLAYQQCVERFKEINAKTFERAAKLKSSLIEWNKQEQYEGHAQLIFRIRDQYGRGVEHYDITIRSVNASSENSQLEKMIEDNHANDQNKGTMTFYLRTQHYKRKKWNETLDSIADVDIEITGFQPETDDISYIPLNLQLTSDQVREVIQSFRTTIIDVVLWRLPSDNVFKVTPD